MADSHSLFDVLSESFGMRFRRPFKPEFSLFLNCLSGLSLFCVCSAVMCSTTAAQQTEDPFALGVRTTEPVSPADQLAAFTVPPGFTVELIASEPDVAKPMNLAFDKRGRLWVSSSLEYPFAASADKTPRDTIRIMEDHDGDGKADRVTVFADELNIPIGLIPYGDGVICFSIPNIWYLRDTDGDDRCDKREVLYGPFDTTRDTHGMCNAFRRGDDGWIYACHGFNNRSEVAGKDGHKVVLTSGNTFRFRPDGSRIELYTQGQVNPFGMSIDQFGDIYTADCHTKPVTLLLPGGCYDSFGRPHDGLGYVPNVMEHLHGSTAIAALALGQHLRFPAEYANSTFDGNVMTSRVNQNTLKRTGSSVRAIEQPDLVSSSDPWFRPVDLVAGPDGALYIADFYNRIIGHYEVDLKHPGRDRYRGRLWRVRYAGDDGAANVLKGYGLDLTSLTTEQLLDVIRTAPEMQKCLARDVIAEDPSAEVTTVLKKHLHDGDPGVRRYAMRLLAQRDASVIEAIAAAAVDDDEIVRVHAFRALRELTLNDADQQTATPLLRNGFSDLSAMVRRSAVAAASRHQSQELIAPLLRMFHTTALTDVHLRHSIRIALRDLLLNDDWFREIAAHATVGMDRLVLADLSLAVKTPAAAEFVAANIHFLGVSQPDRLADYLQFAAAHVSPDAAEGIVAAVRERFSGDRELQRGLLSSMRQGFAQRGQQPPAAVRAWALDVALQLLQMKSLDDLAALDTVPAVSWTYQPHPETPDSNNCWGVVHSRMSADGVGGAALYSSFEMGEGRTGIYRSAAIELGDTLTFYVAGHDGIPDAPLKKANFVRLRDAATEELLREASPLRNDVAQKVEWRTGDLKGRRVVVELVDGDTASAYAWLAVGRFSDERLNPSDDQQHQLAAAELIGDFALRELRPALVRLSTRDGVSRQSQVATAGSFLKLKPNSLLTAVAVIPTITAASDSLAQAAVIAITQENSEEARRVLELAFQVSTAAEQFLLAQPLSEDIAGAGELLRLMESGKASARLLLKPAIQQRLNAIATNALKARAVALTEKLPTEDSIVEELMANRKKAIQQTGADVQNGKELFKKNCQICHQLAGEGKQVGPNLDGIGNRGLDRVLEDVLIPNRNVDVAFRTTTVVTDEGKAYSGLLKELEGNRITIVDSLAKETILQTDIIEERQASANSPMPSNVGETMSEAQLRDLVGFLLLQKKVVEGAKP